MLTAGKLVVISAFLAVSVTVLVARGGDMDAAQGQSVAPSPKGMTTWTMEALLPSLKDLGTGRTYEKGQALFKRGACGGCHAFASESRGGGYAPDLTAVAAKFSRDAILQSILEPSAESNPNFLQTTFTLKDGRVITATIVERDDKKVVVAPVLLALPSTVEIAAADIVSEESSPISAMPAGLLSEFTKDEVVELIAFLEAGGDRNAAVYKKK